MNIWNEDDIECLRTIQKKFIYDPLGYVYFNFPWGKDITDLGPEMWQAKALSEIGTMAGKSFLDKEPKYKSFSTGHGVGKTAMIAWIIKWFLSTRPNAQIIVTANTKEQLQNTTWREVAKWNDCGKDGKWFSHTATKFSFLPHDKTWYATPVAWREEKPQSFAGKHDRFVLVIFDEASEIPDIIWESAEGFLHPAEEALFIACGNPTRNTGKFRDTLPDGPEATRTKWNCSIINAADVQRSSKALIKQWQAEYGENADFVRIRVYGLPPKMSVTQLIPSDIVDAAMSRDFHYTQIKHAPMILGVDVARYGDDDTVIFPRKGLKAFDPIIVHGFDSVEVADVVARQIDIWKPDAVMIDQGQGVGVIDILRHRHYDIMEIPFGSNAADSRFWNKRMEMYWRLKDWLQMGGGMPYIERLKRELVAHNYARRGKGEIIQLESKEDVKRKLSSTSEGGKSPDMADALALTFAYTLSEIGFKKHGEQNQGLNEDRKRNMAYDPLERRVSASGYRKESTNPFSRFIN